VLAAVLAGTIGETAGLAARSRRPPCAALDSCRLVPMSYRRPTWKGLGLFIVFGILTALLLRFYMG
jgi:hypothetical protein